VVTTDWPLVFVLIVLGGLSFVALEAVGRAITRLAVAQERIAKAAELQRYDRLSGADQPGVTGVSRYWASTGPTGVTGPKSW